jgi:hypothetical protein
MYASSTLQPHAPPSWQSDTCLVLCMSIDRWHRTVKPVCDTLRTLSTSLLVGYGGYCFCFFDNPIHVAYFACQSMQMCRKLELEHSTAQHSAFDNNLSVALRQSTTVNPRLQTCICPRPAAATIRPELLQELTITLKFAKTCAHHLSTSRRQIYRSLRPLFSTESNLHNCTSLHTPPFVLIHHCNTRGLSRLPLQTLPHSTSLHKSWLLARVRQKTKSLPLTYILLTHKVSARQG